eukprot:scaffold250218_cov36-Tisochrysis_lutea.AAC.3
MADAILRLCGCTAEAQRAAHWVPDAQGDRCSCGAAFDLFTRRHHCRCCGGLFCAGCSNRRCTLPGWGIETKARVCRRCYTLEVAQLPMLLAGDVWVKAGAWTGLPSQRFVWLAADQSALLWAPWDDGTATADRQRPRRLELRELEGVETATDEALVLRSRGGGLVLEPDGVHGGARRSHAWAAALAALLAVGAARAHQERLYGGMSVDAAASPRTIAISAPHLQHLLRLRQSRLVAAREDELAASTDCAAQAESGLDEEELEREQAELEERMRQRRDFAELHARMRTKYGARGAAQ